MLNPQIMAANPTMPPLSPTARTTTGAEVPSPDQIKQAATKLI